MARLEFEHIDSEMNTSFECYRNEDPYNERCEYQMIVL